MDDPREKHVLLQLINYKTDRNVDKIVEKPFCDDETTSRISKTLSEIIYDPKTRKNQRDTIIALIEKWTGSSHLITENAEIFMEALLETAENNRDEIVHVKPVELGEIIGRKYKHNLQTRIKCGLIDLYNKKVFENTFDVNIPLKALQNSGAESVIDFVHGFSETNLTFTDNLRGTNIDENVVVAVIKQNNDGLMLKLIRYLVENNHLIKYIWANRLNLRLCVCQELLVHCPYLYEKPVLEYFTQILMGNDGINEELRDVFKYCSTNDVLSQNISNLLDTILMLSNYDQRVLRAINNRLVS